MILLEDYIAIHHGAALIYSDLKDMLDLQDLQQFLYMCVPCSIRFGDEMALLIVDRCADTAKKIQPDKCINAPRFLKVGNVYFKIIDLVRAYFYFR